MIEHSSALFISDLHLSETSGQLLARLRQFLEQYADQTEALFVLGDLFEAWIGDDLLLADPERFPVQQNVLASLRDFAKGGKPLYLMHGNRDFLLAQGALRSIGASTRLLPDPSIAIIAGKKTLISHGDQYCTDDIAYQEFRATSRTNAWIAHTLGLSLEQRLAIAEDMRAQSELAKQNKSEAIMDVNPEAIARAFSEHEVSTMVHGHTHRPTCHQLAGTERYVLPDWRVEQGNCRGGGLLANAAGWKFLAL